MTALSTAADELSMGLDRMSDLAPGGAASFRALVAATVGHAKESPSPKSKALLGLALATADLCERCAARYAKEARRTGASRDEVIAVLQRAILFADGPATLIGATALLDFDAWTFTDARRTPLESARSETVVETVRCAAPERPKPRRVAARIAQPRTYFGALSEAASSAHP